MPLVRRVGRPGLLGTAARTAVIAGTATATANAVGRRQAQRQAASYEQQQYEAAEQQRRLDEAAHQAVASAQVQQAQVQQAPVQQPPAASADPLIEKLTQLAELHRAGVLDDAEFAAAKARLLTS